MSVSEIVLQCSSCSRDGLKALSLKSERLSWDGTAVAFARRAAAELHR